MIGTGVFLKTRVMTCNVGSAKTVLLVWLAAGLLSLAGTFSYSEIAAMMPEAGGDYVYLRRAYGTGGWVPVRLDDVCGCEGRIAGGARGGSRDFHECRAGRRFGPLATRGRPVWFALSINGLTVVALATIWTVALINCASVAAGGRTALALTLAKVGLVLGVGIGAFALRPGRLVAPRGIRTLGHVRRCRRQRTRRYTRVSAPQCSGALWAYDGWNNVAPLAGEIRDPQRNLPRAFIGGMLVVAALYLFVNIAYYYALTPARDRERPDQFVRGDRSVEALLGTGGGLHDRRSADDFLIRVAACQCARQFARAVCHGARRIILSRIGAAVAAKQCAGASNCCASCMG